jgi:ketosteroid isomerase-like protein
MYSQEARVIWPGQGEEANGTEQIRRLISKTMKDAPKDAQVIFESQEVIPLDGDKYVAVLGHWQETFTGSDGKKVTLDLRTSEILKKHDGKLLYVVDHASVGLPPSPPSAAKPGTPKKK